MARSASRRGQRRNASGASGFLKGVSAFVVFLAIAGLFVFMYFLSLKPEIDAATNCANNGAIDTTLIFIDDTTPLTQTQSLRVENIIKQYIADKAKPNVPPGRHQFLLTSLKQVQQKDIRNVGCLPRNPQVQDFNELTENKVLLEKQRVNFDSNIEEWLGSTISQESYGEYLSSWSRNFLETGVTVLVTETEVKLVFSDAVTFDSGEDKLSSDGERIIANLAMNLGKNDEFTIRVTGHTDDVGEEESNQALSEKRASNVAAQLIQGGIDASDITILGFGQSEPIADNSSDEGRRSNRRIEITLAPKRPLVEALDRAFALLGGEAVERGSVEVIMISDMAQASALFSVYSGQSWKDFVSSPKGATLNLNPETVTLHLYRILRAETFFSKREVLDFWRNYFDKKSINVVTDTEL